MSILNAVLENTINPSIFDQVETTPVPAFYAEELEGNKDFYGESNDLFTVEKHKIQGPFGDIPKKNGVFVGKKCVNIVSDNYEIHQPAEVYKQFKEVADKTNLTVNRVLPSPTTGGLLMSAKFDGIKVAGDDHDVNLTFYTDHSGLRKTFLTCDLLCIPCFNQVPTLYRNKSRFIFSEKHYKNALNIELIGSVLEHIPETIAAHNEKVDLLSQTKLSLDDFITMWEEHYNVKKESQKYQNRVDKLRSIYYNAPNQACLPQDSAYKAFQCMTFVNTHEGKETALKQENAHIKGGNDSLVWLDELLEIEYLPA